uniref:80 kDa venom protein n=4 Tax=Braconinae TaxID=65225 RepID=A0A493QWE5_9HYME|nr:80 kDa venom protein [Habrobracon hebetor]
MKWFSVICFFLAYSKVTPIFLIPSFSDLKELAEYAYDIYGKFNEVYDAYGTYTTDVDLDKILEEVKDITNTVNQLGTKLEQKVDQAVQIIIRHLPLTAKVDSGLYDLHNYITRIDGMFEEFRWYTSRKRNFNNFTMNHFAQTVVSHRANDMVDTLHKIYRLITPGRTSGIRENILLLLNKHEKMTEAETCDEGLTPQARLFNIYAAVMLTEVRAYIMKCFAYMHLSGTRKGDFKSEIEKAEQQFLKRAKEYMIATKRAMKRAPRYIRRCDPAVHKKNNTYIEFHHFIQGYIVSEETLSDSASCSSNCLDMTKTKPVKHNRCPIDKANYCPLYKCYGKIMNCTYGGGGGWDVCEHNTRSWRRYGWYSDGEGNMNGAKDACVGGFKKNFVYYTPFNACEYCRCICVDDAVDSVSRRVVSLRKQVSDINRNMVVTGLQFFDQDYMVHIQIKQGKLEAEGNIKAGSEEWKPLERFKFEYWTSSSKGIEVFKRDRYANEDIPPTGEQFEDMTYGTDFAVMQWHQRQINIDDIYAPHGKVITGVRFWQPDKPTKRDQSSPIELAIQVTPFNYSSGELIPGDEEWITPATMEDPPTPYARNRTEFSMDGRVGNPIKSLFNKPDSVPNTYVKLQASGLREDAAQSTIPFLDSQPIHGDPGFPLGGVGLFHKGDDAFGGFLALRVFSIDQPKYMSEEIPDNLVATYNETLTED